MARIASMDSIQGRLTLLAIVVVSATTTVAASLRTSTTFDEIVLMAGGARGFRTGAWDIAPDHPPLGLYLYGLPVYLAGPRFPPDQDAPTTWRTGSASVRDRDLRFRYGYSRQFFFTSGNDPVRLAFPARLMSASSAVLLILLVHAWTRSRHDAETALLAALLTAFMPDVLAHGGVAYLDVPVAAGFLATLWAGDALVREPTPGRGALVGVLGALTVGLKLSGLLLVPAIVLLALLEGLGRRWDTKWLRATGIAAIVAIVTGWLVLALAWRGDFTLAGFRYALDFSAELAAIGHGYPSFLAGRISDQPRWYSYPLLFVLKTPLSLQLLLAFAVLALVRSRRPAGGPGILHSKLRMPVVGVAVVAAMLMWSNSLLAFRYALPALPLVAVITAAGTRRIRDTGNRLARAAVSVCVLAFVLGSLSWYPHFLAFTSAWGGGRDNGHRLMIASNLDWGQGLVELRRWMDEAGEDRVWLSYYGSAMPHAYGIRYEPLPSFFALVPLPDSAVAQPGYTVISASNLQPVFLGGDPFESFRHIDPDTVLAHSLLVFRTGERQPLSR